MYLRHLSTKQIIYSEKNVMVYLFGGRGVGAGEWSRMKFGGAERPPTIFFFLCVFVWIMQVTAHWYLVLAKHKRTDFCFLKLLGFSFSSTYFNIKGNETD